MTPDEFATGFVDLYRRARELSVPSLKVTRARARSVSSDLEELVAVYVIANAKKELHIYVDQPVGIGGRKVAYPDLVVLDLKTNAVVSIVDVKTDIGWKRDGIQSMCDKLSKTRHALKEIGTVKLGHEPKARVPYSVSENLSCHLVVGALVNSGNDLQTPEAKKIAEERQVQVYVLTEGKHPNHFSRQQGTQFLGLKIRTQDFSALVSGVSAT